MIQLKQNDKSKEGIYNIFIDDSNYSIGYAFRSNHENQTSYQYFANGASCWSLASQTLIDFEPFTIITFNNLFPWMLRGHSVMFSEEIDEEKDIKYINLAFYFAPNLAFWNEDYSFAEYYEEFKKNLEAIKEPKYEIIFEEEPALRIEIGIQEFFGPIKQILLLFEKDIKETHVETLENIQNKFQRNMVRGVFNFPEELKIPCKQYLEYFAKFLQDIGISATSSLKDEVGKVLFSVTPTDDVEALDKIREALAVYLNLPSSPIVYGDSFKAIRVQQQIENLQHSQRMMVRELQANEKLLIAQSDMIWEKNITISQQQSVIENQQKIIERISSKSIMMDSLENKEELEEVYPGLKIGESKFLKEQLGIHLNPAKVIKTVVKNTLGKDDGKKSVLGLDEDTSGKED